MALPALVVALLCSILSVVAPSPAGAITYLARPAPTVQATAYVGDNVRFDWSPVRDAGSYRVRVERNDSSFQNTTKYISEFSRSFTSAGVYCLYATTVPSPANTDHRESYESSPACVTVSERAKIRLARPQPSSSHSTTEVGYTVTFSWPRVTSAGRYELRVERNDAPFQTTGTSNTIYAPSFSSAGTYCLYVTATPANPNSHTSSYESNPPACVTVTNPPVQLARPRPSSSHNSIDVNRTVTFSWPGVSGAGRYEVRVQRNDSPFQNTGTSNTLFARSFSSAGTYCVYVTATPSNSTTHTRSYESNPPACVTVTNPPVPKIQLAAPRPTVASTGNTNQSIGFDWPNVTSAGSYSIRIERNDSPFQNTTTTSSRFSRSFTSAGTYCLYATANPSNSTTHTTSRESNPPACITITVPAKVRLAKPVPTVDDESLVGQSVDFDWQPVGSAASYTIRIERNDSPFQGTTRTPAGSEYTRSFNSPGVYCLYAKAVPRSGSTTHISSLESNPACVTVTELVKVRLAKPVPTSQDWAIIGERVRFEWPLISGASTYSVRLERNDSPFQGPTGAVRNFTRSFNSTGTYCLYATALPADANTHTQSLESTPACVNVVVEPTDPCRSAIPLDTPTFYTGSATRARIEGDVFKADWADVPCATDYHWRMDGPAGFRQYGGGSASNIEFQLTGQHPAGQYCVSMLAVNGARRPDSARQNANGDVAAGCTSRVGPVDPNSGRLPAPVIDASWVTHSGTKVRFDWDHIEGRAEYHWGVFYPNGHVERGATYRTNQTVDVNGQYGGSICFEVIAVAAGRDSEVSNRFCKIVNDPACARPDHIQPDVYLQQALRGYDLDLNAVEAGADAHNGNDNHIVIQSIFDPVVRNKDMIIDEYGLVFRAGPRFDTLAERQAFLIELATDMDRTLGGYFSQQANFKNQGSPPVVGQIIDIEVNGQFRIDLTHVNAPVVVTHMESTCFGVQTIEYNDDEHVLHGDRRWGFETLSERNDEVWVRFYTRGISIPDRFYPLAESGEWTFWNAWIDEMVDLVEADGGMVVGGTDVADQRKVTTTANDLWNRLSSADRVKVKAFQINSHQREVDLFQQQIDALRERLANTTDGREKIRIRSQISNRLDKQSEHVKEITDWSAIST